MILLHRRCKSSVRKVAERERESLSLTVFVFSLLFEWIRAGKTRAFREPQTENETAVSRTNARQNIWGWHKPDGFARQSP